MTLFERGAGIDYHTVADELVRRHTYQSAGGLLALSEQNVATPTSTHIVQYARIVADYALRRRFVDAAQRVTELACDLRQEVPPEAWTEHLLDYLDRGRAGGLAGVATGLRDFDTMTLGLSPGLYLLAASTGTGKTAVAGQIPLHVAEHYGPVVFV
ncbi:MAG: hypothetical protein JO023_09515, partial [Chloroflexi bacterium]|nr:hypothetical protein [Chloroflexota bacterium]